MSATSDLVGSLKQAQPRSNRRIRRTVRRETRRIVNNVLQSRPRFRYGGRGRRRGGFRGIPSVRFPRSIRSMNLPAAVGTQVRALEPRFRVRTADRLVVFGRDLVLPFEMDETLKEPGVIQVIPANPVLWTGTRVAAIGSGYQYYRPIRLTMTYIPQVPVTVSGCVTCGTLWQQSALLDNLQQTLLTSNGGVMAQVYLSFRSNVLLGTNLPQQKFETTGEAAAQQGNPFNWYMMLSGVADGDRTIAQNPGFVYVDWEYEFVNAQGKDTAQAETISKSSEEAKQAYASLHRTDGLLTAFPWGLAVGLLKTWSRPLLDKVALCVLKQVSSISKKVVLGVGKMLRWSHDNTANGVLQAGTETQVSDPLSGEIMTIPDDTPVIVYQTGLPIMQTTLTKPLGFYMFNTFKIVSMSYSGQFYKYKEERSNNPEMEFNTRSFTINPDEGIIADFVTGDDGVKKFVIKETEEHSGVNMPNYRPFLEVYQNHDGQLTWNIRPYYGGTSLENYVVSGNVTVTINGKGDSGSEFGMQFNSSDMPNPSDYEWPEANNLRPSVLFWVSQYSTKYSNEFINDLCSPHIMNICPLEGLQTEYELGEEEDLP